MKDKQLKRFNGKIIHSVEMKSVHDFKGQRVLVVGSSVSGSDISSELARKGKCAKVVNSVRTVPYYVSRVAPGTNLSSDQVMWKRLPCWLSKVLPDSVTSKGMKAEILANYPDQLPDGCAGEGFIPDPDILKAGVGFTSDYVPCIRQKKLTLKLSVKSASGNQVTFEDGTTEEFDTIIGDTPESRE